MTNTNDRETYWLIALIVLIFILPLGLFVWLAIVPGSPTATLVGKFLDAAFATNSVQTMWYVTRSAGVIAYLLLWLSTVWGLSVSSKIFDPVLNRFFTYDMHSFLSLLALGFLALHVIVLLGDHYLPFSMAQLVVPFIAPYRPIWVAFGSLGLYLSLLVSITFYVRQWIGYWLFHVIHYASLLAYAAAALHGLMSGTDSPLWSMQLMYAGTTLVVVFLFIYRVGMAVINPQNRHVTAD
jgi:methionine sulfoxide reductase heme-binding subunit